MKFSSEVSYDLEKHRIKAFVNVYFWSLMLHFGLDVGYATFFFNTL